MYDLDSHVPEIYDKAETETADVALILRSIGPRTGWHILEPFCGTGRILLPLALDGHTVVVRWTRRGISLWSVRASFPPARATTARASTVLGV